jgi:hypothetical protein
MKARTSLNLAAILFALSASVACGNPSFNINYGNGHPSTNYGAAGPVGYWNTVTDIIETYFKDLNGQSTLVWGKVSNTGYFPGYPSEEWSDLQHLMDSCFMNWEKFGTIAWTIYIEGIANGQYDLYYYDQLHTYCGTGTFTANGIVAPELNAPTDGLAPLQENVNYGVVRGVIVSQETLVLQFMGTTSEWCGLAGIQIVAVPEPVTLNLLGAAMIAAVMCRGAKGRW